MGYMPQTGQKGVTELVENTKVFKTVLRKVQNNDKQDLLKEFNITKHDICATYTNHGIRSFHHVHDVYVSFDRSLNICFWR